MKIRVLVEVSEGGKTMARRMRQTEVSPKAAKLYEAMAGEDAFGFVAEDVMSGAMKVVQGKIHADPGTFVSSAPATDDAGKLTGRTVMEESLGLDIIENMLQKDGAGAAGAQQQTPGQVPGPPPLKVV